MLVSIQHHVEWIADCIAHMQEQGLCRIEALPDAQEQWVDYVNMVADFTLFPSCNSWYLGANVPGKARVFMPLLGFPPYVERCTEVAAKGYEGFALSA
jgi:cyclohexanone monooxygenase